MKRCLVIGSLIISFCVSAQNDSLLREQKMDSLIRRGDFFFSDCNEDSAWYNYNLALEFRNQSDSHKVDHIERRKQEMLFPEWCMGSKYNEIVKKGDSKFAAGDFAGAKILYNQAHKQKPSESYAADMIRKCDEQLAKTCDLGSKPFQMAINAGDSLYAAGNYREAKVKYQEALGIKQFELYPKEQIKMCDAKLATYISPDYYGSRFIQVSRQTPGQFCQQNAPPETERDQQVRVLEMKQTTDSSKRIYVSFYNLHPGKGVQTTIIGVIFIEDSLDAFRPVCIDTFFVQAVNVGMTTCNRIEIISSGKLKGTDEYFVSVGYGGCCSNCPNGGQVVKTYYYNWPENFQGITQIKRLRIIE